MQESASTQDRVPLARLLRWAPLVLMLLGTVLRLETWLDNRSLWLDEALLANAVLDSSGPGALLQPLPDHQAAPTGFLVGSWLVARALGDSEYVLRLLPLLASLAALPLFWALARRLLGAAAGLVALLLFAFAPHVIYYAAEFKPYALDVLAAVGVLLAARNLHDCGYAPRAAVVAAVTGTAAVLFSYAALFTLAGAGLALLLLQVRAGTRGRSAVRVIVGVAGVWLAVFLLDWWLVTADRRAPLYYEFFTGAWPPLPVTPAALEWYWDAGIATVERPLGFYRVPVLALFTALTGAFVLARRDRLTFGLLVFPLFLVAAAAVFRQYPPANRLLLFTVPAFLLLLTVGLAELRGRLKTLSPVLAGVLVLLILAGPLGSGVRRMMTQETRQELREPVEYLLAHYRPGDQIYVFHEAGPAFRYYTREHDLSWIAGAESAAWVAGTADASGLSGRVWFVGLEARPEPFTFRLLPVKEAESQPSQSFAVLLDRVGRQLIAVERTRAAVYLYEL